MLHILNNEKGMTLLEVLVVAIVIVLTILSIYIGVVYAEKQVLRNYRDRVATLLASGEIDWQYYRNRKTMGFQPVSGKSVVIDYLPKGKVLNGFLTLQVIPLTESYGAHLLRYNRIKSTVSWNETGEDKIRNVVMVEDIYIP